MNQNTQTNAPNDMLDLLDEGLCHLKAGDREALVLRYLKEEPIGDIAAALGISAEAARKRIGRGMERLRSYFSSRGVTSSPAVLGALLTEQIRGTALTPLARQSITQGILQVCTTAQQGSATTVAIAKGIKTMMLIAKIKIAAAAVVIAATLGTSGWVISRAVAQKTPSAQATGAAPLADAAPPASPQPPIAAPATQPSAIDLSAPAKAVRSFFMALQAGDRAATYSCLTADPNRPTTLMDAVISWNLAQNHLIHVAAETFGDDGASVRRIPTLDAVARIIHPEPDAQAEGQPPVAPTDGQEPLATTESSEPRVQIDGNTATITIEIPDDVIATAPPTLAPSLRAWAHSQLYLQKQSDQWKFDIDRSMRVDLKVRLKSSKPVDRAMKIGILMDLARGYEQVASAIEAGQLTRPAAASRAVDMAEAQVSAKHAVASIQLNVVPANAAK